MKKEKAQEVISNSDQNNTQRLPLKVFFPFYGSTFEISFKSLTASIKLYLIELWPYDKMPTDDSN